MTRRGATFLIGVSVLVGGCGIIPTGARVTPPATTNAVTAMSAGCEHMDAEGERGLGLNEDFKEVGGAGGSQMDLIPDAGLDALRKDGFDVTIPQLPGDLQLVRVSHPVPWEAGFFFWTHEIGPDVIDWDLISSGGFVVGLLTHRGGRCGTAGEEGSRRRGGNGRGRGPSSGDQPRR